MGTPVKSLENQTKHLTDAEIAAREAAEAGLQRATVTLKKPAYLTGKAARYWQSLVERAMDVVLLDDLDIEMLAGYCSMLARRDQLASLTDRLLREALRDKTDSDESLERTNKLDSLIGKLDKIDRLALSYADKLGFTPQGRVRLAQKRAAAALDDPDSELFGG